MRGYIGSIIFALLAAVAMAAEPTETITVTGSATVFVKPDTARIHYSVRVSDASADAAKDTATKQLATIAESVKGLKLDSLKTTSGSISYSRSSFARAARGPGFGNPGGPGGPGPVGLGPVSAQIPVTATITEKEPDKLRASVDSFIAKISEAGATIAGDADPDSPFSSARSALLAASESHRVDWILSDDATPRRDALRAAVRKAKADAEALSKELGWEKLTILSVADGPSASAIGTDSLPAGRTPAGEVAVSVRVVIKCSR
jgi:uncharacterized protein YggE